MRTNENQLPRNMPCYALSSMCLPRSLAANPEAVFEAAAADSVYTFPELSPLWREFKTTQGEHNFDRFAIPFATTSASQLISGAFPAVKADMQNNPNLKLASAFKARFSLDNAERKFSIGIQNIYRGNAWNYSYMLGCSLTGNNLAQLTRHEAQKYTDNIAAQAALSGVAAGAVESSWTVRLVAGELAKTTGISAPNLRETYRRILPSLMLRDSLGWIVVQANALYLQEQDQKESLSTATKALSFFASGVLAAAISSPADANLTRVYRNQGGQSALGIFSEAVSEHGLVKTLTAGLKPRIFSVSGPFIAYGAAQYWLNKELDNSMSSPRR